MPRVNDYPCAVDGCTRPRVARGFCDPHYRRWRQTGTSGDPDIASPASLADRLAAKLGPPTSSGCIEFMGKRQNKGYGHIGSGGKHGRTLLAHRVAYELEYGPIPDGMLVCHHCDNPPCCNPAHLFLGTKSDNALDQIAKGRPWNRTRGHRIARIAGSPKQFREWIV